ncbi:hypothetical protein C8J57DRAFT_1220915 [Mycena rebaudengoi]|nr:hypothetical protein C8J57DRAFT_1220915 [Mycena rebaudengoi]
MERKDFVLAALLQLTQADIDDYKQWIGRTSNVLEWIKLEQFHDYLVYKSKSTVQNTMPNTQPDLNAHRIADNPPFGGHNLAHEPQSVAISQSFHPPLPLNGPIFVEAHPCPTPIPAPVVVKSVLRDINLAAPTPAPQKRQRQEVDLKNVINEPRARKVRKCEL